jgi:Ca2+/Na+ antiporter
MGIKKLMPFFLNLIQKQKMIYFLVLTLGVLAYFLLDKKYKKIFIYVTITLLPLTAILAYINKYSNEKKNSTISYSDLQPSVSDDKNNEQKGSTISYSDLQPSVGDDVVKSNTKPEWDNGELHELQCSVCQNKFIRKDGWHNDILDGHPIPNSSKEGGLYYNICSYNCAKVIEKGIQQKMK